MDGVHKSWMTEEQIVKAVVENSTDYEARWSADWDALLKYSSGDSPFKSILDDFEYASPPYAYHVSKALTVSGQSHAKAMISLFQKKDMDAFFKAYARSVCFEYWRSLIQSRVVAKTAPLSFANTIRILSDLVCLGWITEAEILLRQVAHDYKNSRYFDVNEEFSHPLYHWLFRICLDKWNIAFDSWGKSFYGEAVDVFRDGECLSVPELNSLFDLWKAEDLSTNSNTLIWLNDYYISRTVGSSLEFSNDLLHTRYPAVILAWFRLRSELGLPLPNINHPLMKPDYARLAPAQAPYSDSVIDSVIKRLRDEELSDLGIVREEPFVSDLHVKKGWLAKLLKK